MIPVGLHETMTRTRIDLSTLRLRRLDMPCFRSLGMGNLHRHPKSRHSTRSYDPTKFGRQHEKAWVLLTFPTSTQLIYSLQSHSRLTQPPSVSPVPSPLTTSSFSSPSDDIHCQVCQSPFDEHQMLLCDMCDAGWHMDCLLHPLPLSHMQSGSAPYASRATSYPSQQHFTFTFLPPSSILTLIKILQ